LRRLARTRNCAIVVFHHTGKDGKNYRGSSAIRGSVDNLLFLRWAKKGEKKGQKSFVVLEDNARRRRAGFPLEHLTRYFIERDPDAVREDADGEDGRLDDSEFDGFIWATFGPVGEEEPVASWAEKRLPDAGGGDVEMDDDGEDDDGEGGANPATPPPPGEEGRDGQRERAGIIVSLFPTRDATMARKELERGYAAATEKSEESGKNAVNDAVAVQWVMKSGDGIRAPYQLTPQGWSVWHERQGEEA
jgi:hypothetical protein